MRIQEVVGQRVREARRDYGRTQAQLGEALARYLPRGWKTQVVSQAEKGEREFTAVELVALALVLDRPVAWFFVPPTGVAIDFPTGQVDAGEVSPLLIQGVAAEEVGALIRESVEQLSLQMERTAALVERIRPRAIRPEDLLSYIAIGGKDAAQAFGMTEEEVEVVKRELLSLLGAERPERVQELMRKLAASREDDSAERSDLDTVQGGNR